MLTNRLPNNSPLSSSRYLLAGLALVFLVVYCFLATPIATDTNVGQRFDWPDETANYFWSKYYAQSGELTAPEPLNFVAQNQIYPRSFNVRSDGSLVPGSFLGLILLFGTIAKIFGSWSLIYLTPLLGVLAVFAFYIIVKEIFNPKIALIAAILMLFNPAWWYYSVTAMLPNVAFVSLLLMSIAFLFGKKFDYWQLLLSAFLLGLAVLVRPSEFIWIGFIYLVLVFYLRPKLNLVKVILYLAVVATVILPIFYQQQILYGSFLASGYSQLQDQSSTCQWCDTVKSLILPFGFHPRLLASNLWTHYFSRLWWLSLLAVLGLVAFLTQRGKPKPETFVYILLSLVIFGWLGVYYGSWEFADQLTVHLNTLGLSYVRYWLPLYLMALPFVAISLIFLSQFFPPRWRRLVIAFLLLALFYQSASLVLFKKPDSIVPVRQRIAEYKNVARQVYDLTPEDAVIVTVRKDKVFFPQRAVIHTFEALSLNPALIEILPALKTKVPLYYYALGPEPQLKIADNLILEEVANIGQEVLYQIK
ncbi:MAG: glycosyltransferase family 39 protein [Patescibacteria group bacterium]|jgi:hypothetical protein|nr:glycosyltransferase family 39 protein [Patescibacteria group bacterium]